MRAHHVWVVCRAVLRYIQTMTAEKGEHTYGEKQERKDIVVFDLETMRDFTEVGGREHLDKLGVSVVGAYSYAQNAYLTYEARELAQFETVLASAGLIVGFNIRGFDLPVLQPHVSVALKELPVLDLMDNIVERLGFRVALDSLARASLGTTKSADGLQAVRWWREGNIAAIKEYCLQDVRITKELYEFGKTQRHVCYLSRQTGRKESVPVSWGVRAPQSVPSALRDAFVQRRRVRLVYAESTTGRGKAELPREREVDIHKIGKDTVEGFCHLRNARRTFRTDRIISAVVGEATYRTHDDVQESLL